MEAIEREIDHLEEEEPGGVYAAMLALKKRGAEAVEPLAQVLRDRERPATLRARVVDTLALIGTPGVVDHLTEALVDPDVQVRIHAIGALGELGDPAALPALEKLTDRDGGILVIDGTQYIAVQDELHEAIRLIRERSS